MLKLDHSSRPLPQSWSESWLTAVTYDQLFNKRLVLSPIREANVDKRLMIFQFNLRCSSWGHPNNITSMASAPSDSGVKVLSVRHHVIGLILMTDLKRHETPPDQFVVRKMALGQSHKSHKCHNALDKYPITHHSVTDIYTHVHISVTKWCIMRYETGGFLGFVQKVLGSVRVTLICSAWGGMWNVAMRSSVWSAMGLNGMEITCRWCIQLDVIMLWQCRALVWK